jgi:hypothetical protein
MITTTVAAYSLILTDHERNTLVDILEEVLKETKIELRRTEAFHAQAVVRSKEETIEAILRKVGEAAPTKD